MLYAQYLGKRGRPEEAARNLEAALQYAGDNPLTHYNIGLLYFDLRMYDKALVQAHTARKLGFPRADLEESLRKQGSWRDPE
jgi:tetratricopeptide (TPR) repeat protein